MEEKPLAVRLLGVLQATILFNGDVAKPDKQGFYRLDAGLVVVRDRLLRGAAHGRNGRGGFSTFLHPAFIPPLNNDSLARAKRTCKWAKD